MIPIGIINNVGAGSRKNLMPNPSFETSLNNVTANACIISRTSSFFASGSSALAITPDTAYTDTFAKFDGDAGGMRLGMVAGRTYTASGVVYTPVTQTGTSQTGRERSVVLFWKRSGQAYEEAASTPGTNGPVAGGERVSVTVTLPADTVEAFVRFYNGYSNSATNAVYWDSMLLEESSSLLSYFDGSYPLAAWTGTAHESPSTMSI